MRPIHFVVLIIVVLIVFGSAKLPDIARSVGQSMKVFKKEVQDLREDDADADATTEPESKDTP